MIFNETVSIFRTFRREFVALSTFDFENTNGETMSVSDLIKDPSKNIEQRQGREGLIT